MRAANSRKIGLFVGYLLGGTILASPGYAQSAAPAVENGAADGADALGPEQNEIIVTARKRDESVQDVPLAISVVTAEQLENRAPKDLVGLNGSVPNFTIIEMSSSQGAASIFMRGQGFIDIERTQQPPVGVLIDGVFLASNVGQLMDNFDLAQLEISRGPQGLFQGRNTTAGLIDVKRTRPTGYFGGRASLSYGSFHELTAKGILNLPEVAGISTKLGVNYRENDGYAHNIYTGKREGGIDMLHLHAMMRAEPTDALDALLVLDYIDTNGVQTPSTPSNRAAIREGLSPDPGIGPNETAIDMPADSHAKMYRASLELNLHLPIGTLTSITGYIDADERNIQDFDAGCGTDLQGLGCAIGANPSLPSLHFNRISGGRQFTQEVRLVSELTDTLTSTAGGYYFAGKSYLTQFTDLNLEQWLGPDYAYITEQNVGETSKSYAGFFAIDWAATDRLSLSGGLRYIKDKKKFNSEFLTDAKVGPLQPGPVINVDVPYFDDSVSFDGTLFQFSGKFELTPFNNLYATYAEGFRSGGFTNRATLSELDPSQPNFSNGERFNTFKPETVTSYEIGSKNAFFDRQFIANVAAFYQIVNGRQEGVVVTTPGYGNGTNTYINNVGKLKGWGLEGEFTIRPRALPGFSIDSSFGYQKFKVKDALVDARRFSFGPGGLPGTSEDGMVDVSDSATLIFTPKFQYSVTGTYETDLSNDMRLTTSATWRHQSKINLAAFLENGDPEPGYGLLDGKIKLDWQDRYSLALIGRNILEKHYRYSGIPSLFIEQWAPPRQISVEAQMRF